MFNVLNENTGSENNPYSTSDWTGSEPHLSEPLHGRHKGLSPTPQWLTQAYHEHTLNKPLSTSSGTVGREMCLWFGESLINDTMVTQNNYCPRNIAGGNQSSFVHTEKWLKYYHPAAPGHLLPQRPSVGGPSRSLKGCYTLESPVLCMAKARKGGISEMAGDEEPGLPSHLISGHWKVDAPRLSENEIHPPPTPPCWCAFL